MPFDNMHGGAEPNEIDDAGGQDDAKKSPRLEAIMELLKFLSQSEARRAMPKPTSPAAGMPGAADDNSMSDDDLEALKSFAGR